MKLFRKPARRPAALPQRDPLAAVPRIAPDVEAEVDNLGLIQVRRRYHAHSRLGRLLRFRYQRQLHLDAPGSFYWRQIDGTRTLETIAARVSAERQCPLADARRAVATFTRDLMQRDLVQLQVEDPS